MSYVKTKTDNKNFKLFDKNSSVNSLKSIELVHGSVRCLKPMEIDFKYPITALVGENGAGKSTILGLVSCAFHNDTDFCPSSLYKNTTKLYPKYYTYHDFLTFTPPQENRFVEDIEIKSSFLCKNSLRTDIRKKSGHGK